MRIMLTALVLASSVAIYAGEHENHEHARKGLAQRMEKADESFTTFSKAYTLKDFFSFFCRKDVEMPHPTYSIRQAIFNEGINQAFSPLYGLEHVSDCEGMHKIAHTEQYAQKMQKYGLVAATNAEFFSYTLEELGICISHFTQQWQNSSTLEELIPICISIINASSCALTLIDLYMLQSDQSLAENYKPLSFGQSLIALLEQSEENITSILTSRAHQSVYFQVNNVLSIVPLATIEHVPENQRELVTANNVCSALHALRLKSALMRILHFDVLASLQFLSAKSHADKTRFEGGVIVARNLLDRSLRPILLGKCNDSWCADCTQLLKSFDFQECLKQLAATAEKYKEDLALYFEKNVAAQIQRDLQEASKEYLERWHLQAMSFWPLPRDIEREITKQLVQIAHHSSNPLHRGAAVFRLLDAGLERSDALIQINELRTYYEQFKVIAMPIDRDDEVTFAKLHARFHALDLLDRCRHATFGITPELLKQIQTVVVQFKEEFCEPLLYKQTYLYLHLLLALHEQNFQRCVQFQEQCASVIQSDPSLMQLVAETQVAHARHLVKHDVQQAMVFLAQHKNDSQDLFNLYINFCIERAVSLSELHKLKAELQAAPLQAARHDLMFFKKEFMLLTLPESGHSFAEILGFLKTHKQFVQQHGVEQYVEQHIANLFDQHDVEARKTLEDVAQCLQLKGAKRRLDKLLYNDIVEQIDLLPFDRTTLFTLCSQITDSVEREQANKLICQKEVQEIKSRYERVTGEERKQLVADIKHSLVRENRLLDAAVIKPYEAGLVARQKEMQKVAHLAQLAAQKKAKEEKQKEKKAIARGTKALKAKSMAEEEAEVVEQVSQDSEVLQIETNQIMLPQEDACVVQVVLATANVPNAECPDEMIDRALIIPLIPSSEASIPSNVLEKPKASDGKHEIEPIFDQKLIKQFTTLSSRFNVLYNCSLPYPFVLPQMQGELIANMGNCLGSMPTTAHTLEFLRRQWDPMMSSVLTEMYASSLHGAAVTAVRHGALVVPTVIHISKLYDVAHGKMPNGFALCNKARLLWYAADFPDGLDQEEQSKLGALLSVGAATVNSQQDLKMQLLKSARTIIKELICVYQQGKANTFYPPCDQALHGMLHTLNDRIAELA